jgi:Fic family protein
MKEIDALYKEWQGSQPLSPENQKRLDQKFMLKFNYNSNHLEGNTLTYGQTKLLLMFGETSGDAKLRDYEEMKAHNVGLELVKREAKDKERPLTENFIRELNRTILVEDFYKTQKTATGVNRYEVKVGQYKTRPNSVITATGEMFDYASPEETPALMRDLITWYNEEERKRELCPIQLATLLHYRYIRIHPFEDGNGRIARLLVNYVLMRHNYPMIIVQSKDKESYLNALHKCDVIVGLIPSDGANATLEQVEPFIEYMENIAKHALEIAIKAGKGESIEEEGDWKKKLQIKLKEKDIKPAISLEEKQAVVVNSYYKTIKAIDNAFFPFEQYFSNIKRHIPGALKTIEELRTKEAKGIAGMSYKADYQIYNNKPTFTYEVYCKFEELDYSIYVSIGNQKHELIKRYNEFLSETEIVKFVDFAGSELSKFVDDNLLGKDE